MVPQALIDSGDTDALVSATIATAEKRLCVTQLLDAATIQSDACDDHSMMTYISLFCDACLPEAPALDSARPEESAVDAAPEDPTTTLKDADTNTSPATAAPVSDSTPPLQRAADWRAYSGIDLGGRCRIRVCVVECALGVPLFFSEVHVQFNSSMFSIKCLHVSIFIRYYSTTTHSVLVRKNTECLQTLFEALKVHQREDFEVCWNSGWCVCPTKKPISRRLTCCYDGVPSHAYYQIVPALDSSRYGHGPRIPQQDL